MPLVWDLLRFSLEPPPRSDVPMAAVLAPLYEDPTGAVRLILTKRPLTMPTHAGHLAFPGGRPHPGDQGPVDTALRETEEEIGVLPGDVEVLGYLAPIHTVEFALYVVPVVGRLRSSRPLLRPSPREVDKVLTPRLDELADEATWRYELWRGRQVWFFDLEGEVLWGATARMVRELLGLDV
jgi:8-oxo-dGTP pyrophosphatase MutT (NUDIX family)